LKRASVFPNTKIFCSFTTTKLFIGSFFVMPFSLNPCHTHKSFCCWTGFHWHFSIPRELAIIGQPDSVCHQWSITGIGMCCYHSSVALSQRSPAKITFLRA
jgi:hypothetical protein